ncbi:MAG TPA: DUF503 domain-containing protein [Polyangiaceae bacterium]
MFVGVLRLVFSIPGARSLKERRRVVKSFKDRVRAKMPVSIAEIGDLERYQVATLGVAVVSNDSARCSEVMSAVTRMARGTRDAVLADVATEIMTLGSGGSGIRGGIERTLDDHDFAPDAAVDEDDDE